MTTERRITLELNISDVKFSCQVMTSPSINIKKSGESQTWQTCLRKSIQKNFSKLLVTIVTMLKVITLYNLYVVSITDTEIFLIFG